MPRASYQNIFKIPTHYALSDLDLHRCLCPIKRTLDLYGLTGLIKTIEGRRQAYISKMKNLDYLGLKNSLRSFRQSEIKLGAFRQSETQASLLRYRKLKCSL